MNRSAFMCDAIRKVLYDHAHGQFDHDAAEQLILDVFDTFTTNKPFALDAQRYFPFWFIGMSWQKHGGPVKTPKHDPADRRTGLYTVEASRSSDCPAVVLDTIPVDPIELPLPPHGLGPCLANEGSALSARQAIHTAALEEGHVTGAHVSSSLHTNNSRPDNPVASPGSPTNLPGPFIRDSLTPFKNGAAFKANDASLERKPAKSYYKGKTLVYVKFDSTHFVADGHWEEYLALRRECPETVRIFDKQREMKEALAKEGVLA